MRTMSTMQLRGLLILTAIFSVCAIITIGYGVGHGNIDCRTHQTLAVCK